MNGIHTERPRGIVAAGPVSFRRSAVRQAAEVFAWRMGSARALPFRIAFFTSPIALVMRISRADFRAVEDGAAAPHAFAIVEDVQPLVGRGLAAFMQPGSRTVRLP